MLAFVPPCSFLSDCARYKSPSHLTTTAFKHPNTRPKRSYQVHCCHQSNNMGSTTAFAKPTYVDLGVTCTPIADMTNYSECHSAYVTSTSASTPASTATAASTTLVKLAGRTAAAAPTGLFGDLTASANGQLNYVMIGLILAVAVLGLVVGLLSYCWVRRHRRRKAGGK